MAGPWEDFKSPAKTEESPPWADFQASRPQVAAEAPPWQDFQSQGSPGMLDYLVEAGKAFARGAVEASVATPLRGLGSQNLGPDQTMEAALERTMRGEAPAEAVQGAFAENRQPLPVTQNPAYQLGEQISGVTNRVLPDRNILNPVVRDVAGGFGSVAGNIATTLLTPSIAVPSLFFQGAGEAGERAVKAGATDDQIRRAANLGNLSGATEFADAALPMLGTVGKTLGFLQRVGVRVAIGAFVEGGQEGLQQFIQNSIAKGVYKPKQDRGEDVPYSMLIGAIVGGGVGGAMAGRREASTPPTPEMLATSAAPIGSIEAPPSDLEKTRSDYRALWNPETGLPFDDPGASQTPQPAQVVQPSSSAAPPLISRGLTLTQRANVYEGMNAGGNQVRYSITQDLGDGSFGVVRSEYEGGPGGPTVKSEMFKDGGGFVPQPEGRGWSFQEDGVQRFATREQAEAALRADAATQPVPTPLPSVYDDVVVEPPSAKTLEEQKVATLSPTIVDFIEKQAPEQAPLQVPKDPSQISFDDLLSPVKEEIQSSPGANTARLAKLLGPKLYGDPSNITGVSVKEMFQNSFDAIKSMLEKGMIDEGNIDINMDAGKRTISLVDNGSGMTPQVLGKQFLEIAGTQKESKRASGGLGIAKMLFIFGNKNLHVTTMRDGKVSELVTTGEQLFTALDDRTKAPQIQVRSPTAQDLRMFPRGHGTRVEVKVPETYIDSSTGEAKGIQFSTWDGSHPVLKTSPLFDNINVKFNGQLLELGSNFPLENYTQLSRVNFDWGTARIYVEKEPNPDKVYADNAHVLSNGLWQFSLPIKADPLKPYGKNIPFQIYIDVSSNAAPEESGYPFDLNRQQFSPQTKKDFANILNYIGLLYRQADLQQSASNFGSMQFLDYDPQKKSVRASETKKVEPKVEVKDNPFTEALRLLRRGKSFKVVDGQLVIDGVQVPELDPKKLAEFEINYDDLKIDQSEIDPKRVILHDNVEIVVSSVETRSVTEYGRERFGKRFDEYMFALGNAFKELRDNVVRYMPGPQIKDDGWGLEPSMAVGLTKQKNGYEELATEGIGISYDQEYRGVSIKLPFSGMFLNPAVPEYNDPLRSALGMVGTMVHELAHYKVRSHDANFPAEMQRILIMLDSNPHFSFHAFKQKVINIVAAYEEVHTHMNEVFTSGDFTIRPRGKRFQDSGSNEVRDGGPFDNVARLGGEPESGARLSYWVAASQAASASESGRGGAANQTGRSRSHGPSDNGRARNYATLRGIDPGITAPPQQLEIEPIRQGVNNIVPPGPGRPPELNEAASHADRYNWFYKWFTGLTELLDANPYFLPLRNYVERVRMMHNDETKVHDAALRIAKDWRSLGTQQSKNLEAFILELQEMPYLTSGERSMNLWRHPTQQEFNALVAKHKLSNEALALYNRLRAMDETFLKLVEQNAVEDAQRRIKDPVKLMARLDEIRTQGHLARAQPFFPFTRFGRYYLVVKDAAGKPVSFETFEPKRFVGLSIKRAEKYQMARKKILEKRVPPGHTVETGVLPETAEPLIGMPTLLLQSLMTQNVGQNGAPGLTQQQIDSLEMLQLMRNPAMSLKHRTVYGDPKIPGYSDDLQRSFARYYFHGGRYYAKAKHSWALRGHIGEAQRSPGNKAGLIASYMNDHLENTVLDARGDFGYFKGAIFLWAMGYVPAAATQNLTQTPMITLPFLAAKFGDGRASAALVRAMTQVSNFYRRGTYDKISGFEFTALGYGIRTGRISETQAPELAGIASGGNLINGRGGTRPQRYAAAFIEKAAFMFEMAEQFNRRIAFRAALELAQDKPNAKFVKESIQKYRNEYEALISGAALRPGEAPLTETQAASVITAIHAVDQTQYVYARYARPRFMRGPLKSTLFVFKRYMQSTLVMLGHNKSDVLPRYLVIAMLMGGLGGIPGWEDMVGIFNAFAKWYFGKDVNVQRLVREYVLQWFDGKLPPDMVLQGLARRGFGLPALMDMMGSFFTGKEGRGFSDKPGQSVPMPVLDRSRALSMGNILPIELGKLLEPSDKQDKMIADQTQKASGAVFSVGFNMYKAFFDRHMEWGDPKRWERAVPRALGSVSRSYRAFSEGRERAKGGPDSAPTIIRYDVRDTEQMLEALALAGGYQPMRLQAKWDVILAKAEVTAYYDLKRKALLEQFFEARKGQNKEEIGDVRNAILKFNQGLPEYARGKVISGETIQRSMQARERSLQARESGVPAQKTNVPLARHIDKLFPETTVDVRRVR